MDFLVNPLLLIERSHYWMMTETVSCVGKLAVLRTVSQCVSRHCPHHSSCFRSQRSKGWPGVSNHCHHVSTCGPGQEMEEDQEAVQLLQQWQAGQEQILHWTWHKWCEPWGSSDHWPCAWPVCWQVSDSGQQGCQQVPGSPRQDCSVEQWPQEETVYREPECCRPPSWSWAEQSWACCHVCGGQSHLWCPPCQECCHQPHCLLHCQPQDTKQEVLLPCSPVPMELSLPLPSLTIQWRPQWQPKKWLLHLPTLSLPGPRLGLWRLLSREVNLLHWLIRHILRDVIRRSWLQSYQHHGVSLLQVSTNHCLCFILISKCYRSRPRPRPAPIYEKHCDYGVQYGGQSSAGQYGTLSRAHIAQATVVNLVKSQSSDRQLPRPAPQERSACQPADQPPPLPPRPVSGAAEPPLPLPANKPKSKVIMSGAISLPRRRDQFKEAARRRGSYHDAFTNKENSGATDNDLYIEAEDKVTQTTQSQQLQSIVFNIQFSQLLLLFNKDINLTSELFTASPRIQSL